MGGRSLLPFFLLLVGTAIVIMPIGVLAFRLLGANTARPRSRPARRRRPASSPRGATPGFSAWLTSLIPTNPVAAAANGAMRSFSSR